MPVRQTHAPGGQDLKLRTKRLALRVIRLFSALPKKTEAQLIGKQLFRSGTSVGANYREATRARSKAEFCAKLGICEQELDESIYWTELLAESGILPEKRLLDLRSEMEELLRIMVASIKRSRASSKKKTQR